MRHYLPVVQIIRAYFTSGCRFVWRDEIVEIGDAADDKMILAKAPAFGADPRQIFERIAPCCEFPVEQTRDRIVLDQIITGAEIAVNESGFFLQRCAPLAPAQSPFKHRMRFVQGVEISTVCSDAIACVKSLQEF